jgi:hypothetical protein
VNSQYVLQPYQNLWVNSQYVLQPYQNLWVNSQIGFTTLSKHLCE